MADEPAKTPGSDESPRGDDAAATTGNGGQVGSTERRSESRRGRRSSGAPATTEPTADAAPAASPQGEPSEPSEPATADAAPADAAPAEPAREDERRLTRDDWADNSRLLLGVSPHVVRGAFVDYDADAEIPEHQAKLLVQGFLNRPIQEDTPGGSQ